MSTDRKPVWVITGASSGIGQELALRAAAFANVVAVGRQSSGLERVVKAGCRFVVLDVTSDQDSINNAVNTIAAQEGSIDVLVNAAGYLLEGSVEETSDNELQHVFATHVFGPLRLVRAALPLMRRDHHGVIANVAGIGALRGAPNAGAYCSSKAALTTLTESLQQELAPLGIQVCLIQLGHFRTAFLQPNHRRKAKHTISDYETVLTPIRSAFNALDGAQQGSPFKAAEVIVKLLTRHEVPPLLPVGPDVLTAELVAHEERRDRMLELSEVTSVTDIAF